MKLPTQSIATAEMVTSPPQGASRLFGLIARLSALAALGIASGALYWQAAYLHSLKGGISEYIIIFLLQFSLYLGACWLVVGDHGSLWVRAPRWGKFAALSIVLLVAAVVRAGLVDKTPFLSSDVYRYIWDGRVQAAGINPYRYLPSEPELAHLRDDAIYSRINRREFAHTIYPPAAQALFLAIYLISPSSVTGFKAAMSILDLAAIAAIMIALRRSGLSPVCAIVFAWHPLVIWEGAHSGHIESAAIAFLAAALLAWAYKKPAVTGVAIALATLVKFYPALLLPVFMFSTRDGLDKEEDRKLDARGPSAGLREICLSKRNLRMLGAFAATIVLGYLPYLSVGSGVAGYLSGYLQEEGFVESGSRYFVLRLIREVADVPALFYVVMAAGVLGGFALRALYARKRNAADVAALAGSMVGLFLVLSTPRFSWYIAWIIPFLCFVPRAGYLYLSGASVLLYLLWFTNDYPAVPIWLGGALYVPALLLLAWERWKLRGRIVSG